MSKQLTWILIVIALLVGLYAGYYYEKTKMVGLLNTQQANMQQQIDSLKAAAKQVTVTPTLTPEPTNAGY